jgi:hypothetical protein
MNKNHLTLTLDIKTLLSILSKINSNLPEPLNIDRGALNNISSLTHSVILALGENLDYEQSLVLIKYFSVRSLEVCDFT